MQDNQPEPLIEIDHAEFRVPAHDDKGHDSRISIKVHPGMSTQLRRILDSKWFPYETTHHIVRHALKRHFIWLETLAPIPDSVLHRTLAIMEMLVEEEQQDRFSEIIGKMEKQIGSYLGRGNVNRAKSLAKRILEQIEEMPEGTWKDLYRNELNDKFGYLLNPEDKRAASLVELDNES